MKDTLIYPSEPPIPVPKPKFQKGVKPAPPPKESLWGVHDPAIYRDPESHMYYIYSTGANCLRSEDLIHWERLGRVVEAPPQESLDWVGDRGIWAPDIVKVGKEYRLYCSNSSWGVRQSCIFLAVADNPEGPFIPRGCVLKTSEPDSPCNAIDANIIEDEVTGNQYMLYGSFWGGCHMILRDKETGPAAEEGVGKCVARRPRWADCAIEGPYIRYNPATGYYYLFVSYGSLKSDYNIRVGRSKNVTGPYIDVNGREMTDLEDYDNSLGYMIACGYKYENGVGYMGPGHNSVLHDDDDRWYVICHIREHNFKGPEISTMHCYQMLWSDDGWPLLVPEVYSGEKMQSITADDLIGEYERIKLTPTVPQGITHSVPLRLMKNGRLELCSIFGRWEMIDDTTIQLKYANIVETCKIIPVWDHQLWKPTLAFTGKDQNGICVWGKKVTHTSM